MNKRIKKKHRKYKRNVLQSALWLKYSDRITKPRYKQLEIAVIRKAVFLSKKFAANVKTIRRDFVNEEG